MSTTKVAAQLDRFFLDFRENNVDEIDVGKSVI